MPHGRSRVARIEVARRQREPQRGAVAAFGQQRFEIRDEIAAHSRFIVAEPRSGHGRYFGQERRRRGHSAHGPEAPIVRACRRLTEHDHDSNRRTPAAARWRLVLDRRRPRDRLDLPGGRRAAGVRGVRSACNRRRGATACAATSGGSSISRRRPQGAGFVLESPTWRAGFDWGAKLGFDARCDAAR